MGLFDPWRLRTLQALAQRGTMAAVAAEFSISPSAVSQQIAALERELGVQLIEPDRRRVRLTVAGQTLVAHADTILSAMQDATDELQAVDRDIVGEVRIAAFPSAASQICPQAMMRVKAAHPRQLVTLLDLEPHDSIAALRAGNTDIAIVDGTGLPHVHHEPQFTYQELLVDALYCVMPHDHPAARKRAIVLADMQADDWVMEDESSWFFRQVMELCNAAGLQPRVVAHCRTFVAAMSLVRAGVGISIQPGMALPGNRGVVARPLKPAFERHIYAVYRRGASRRPSIQTALAALSEEAARIVAVDNGTGARMSTASG
jgi:DNA-binding transcriptional LysR family regulator